ncbi:hypothetical protein FQN57_006033 [Myotisia sp. PD_48]|nr:hypothetical protein FQN57_006033 [Myotisia sp. PD_48]
MSRPSSRKMGRKRQTRLSFAPATSSPQLEESPGSDLMAHIRPTDSNSSPLPDRSYQLLKIPPPHGTKLSSDLFLSSGDESDSIKHPSPSPPNKAKSLIKMESRGPFNLDSDSSDIITSSPAKRRRKNAQVANSSKLRSIKQDNITSESDSDAVVGSSPVRRRKQDSTKQALAKAVDRTQDNLEAHKGSGSKRRRLDLEEDLEDLHDTREIALISLSPKTLVNFVHLLIICMIVVIKGRTRGVPTISTAKAKRQQQLDALKRRRAGAKSDELNKISIESQDSDQGEEESNGSNSGSSSSSSSAEEVLVTDSDATSNVSSDLDQYEDDFVVDDPNAELGAPTGPAELPFEFSKHRCKRPKDHFKDIIEWMVHNKLNPAFPRDDMIYKTAFQKITDEVFQIAGSQLVSSVWNANFRRALEARPGIVTLPYPTELAHPCDACNRSKHPASFDLRFDGDPYLLETLESIVNDSSDDNDDSRDPATFGNTDRNGNEIPDEDSHFYLGRHCGANAIMAHTLIHWRYNLNGWVLDYLKRKRLFEDKEIITREHWSHKKRTKFANEIVDSMAASGEVERLWRDFNINLKSARGEKKSRFG